MKKKVNKKDEIETYMLEGMSIGMCIGTSLGVIIGLFTDNIPICICFGISIGLCVGLGIGSLIKKNKQQFKIIKRNDKIENRKRKNDFWRKI